jgi:DNA-binding IclR family transcriptional regulator
MAAMNSQVKSAARVLDVLEMFAATPGAVGVTEVARKLSLPKSSAQGLLATLAARGYLAREATSYFLPQELRAGGWVGGRRARLLALAEPVLHRIAHECGESAFLGTLVGNQIQYVAKSIGPQEIRYDASLSDLRPVYCTSTGLVILAHLDPAIAKGILSRTKIIKVTPNTVTDRDTIDRMIERATQAGFAEVRNANLIGASGVAAPVFGPRGEVLAALSIGAPTSRYVKSRRQLTATIVAEAAALSKLFRAKAEKPMKLRPRSGKGS